MDRRVIKTRAAIRAAYFELLAEGDVTRMSVSEIARRADIDRKTFYLHYTAVEDISKEYLNSCVEELINNMKLNGYIDNPLRFELAFGAINSMVEHNNDFLRLLVGIDEGKYFWNRLRPMLIDIVLGTYGHGNKVTDTEFRCYISYNVSGIIRLYVDHLSNPEEVSLDMVCRLAADILKRGLSSVIEMEK